MEPNRVSCRRHRLSDRLLQAGIVLGCVLLGAAGAVRPSVAGAKLGSGNSGIGFGNSPVWRGLRFNGTDRHVLRVDGLNFTLAGAETENPDARYRGIDIGVWSGIGRSFDGLVVAPLIESKSISGVSISLGAQAEGRMAGIHVGAILGDWNDDHVDGRIQGIAVGVFSVITPGRIAGITVGGFVVGAHGSITGVTVGGFGVVSPRITGLTLAGWAVGGERVRGLSAALAEAGGRDVRGVTLSMIEVRGDDMRGIMAAPYATAGRATGLMIAIVNRAKELHGVQLGILNLAGNNHGWRRRLPIVNAHF